jgi:hypothetical protein
MQIVLSVASPGAVAAAELVALRAEYRDKLPIPQGVFPWRLSGSVLGAQQGFLVRRSVPCVGADSSAGVAALNSAAHTSREATMKSMNRLTRGSSNRLLG